MKYRISLFLIISSYVFGVICIQLGYWPSLVNFTWFQMILSSVILYINHEDDDRSSIFNFFVISSSIGFIIELIGVNTGRIFGEYTYGSTLGFKVLGTPPVIGLNWFIVCYLAGYVTDWLIPKLNILIKTAIAAMLIVLLDILIEPDAISQGMWNWAETDVPLQNYLAWFVVGLFIEYHYFKNLQGSKNKLALVTAAFLTLFFVL